MFEIIKAPTVVKEQLSLYDTAPTFFEGHNRALMILLRFCVYIMHVLLGAGELLIAFCSGPSGEGCGYLAPPLMASNSRLILPALPTYCPNLVGYSHRHSSKDFGFGAGFRLKIVI